MNAPMRLPRLPAAILRRLLPHADRREVLDGLAEEYAARLGTTGRAAASAWLWRQVLGSVPALVRRGLWRGWTGFGPRADWSRPGGAALEGWAMDVRYALRRLRLRPSYAVLTVLTLSLGVSGTAAVYGIAQRLLLDPLPVAAEEELAVFWMDAAWTREELTYLRQELDEFRGLAAYQPMDVTLDPGDGLARLVRGYSTTADLFQVLGASPVLGPGFQPGDDLPGAEPTAVLSHSLWRELGGDPGIVGRRIELAGEARTVRGVMPPGFWFPNPEVRVWTSMVVDPESQTGNLSVVARLPAGTDADEAQAAADRVAMLLGERFQYPEGWDKTVSPVLTPLRTHLVGPVRPAVLALLGAMLVILLVACVNVAALMLGQVDGRGSELAVRSALGAGRGRLLRQIVVESAVIGVLAGGVGAGLALLGFPVLAGALPLGALAETVTPDWKLFSAAMAIALLAATALALVPGASVARGDVQARLTRSRTAGVAGRGGRLESALVVAQVALVLLMASGAALLVRSVANLRAIDPGLDPAGVAVVDIVMPATTPMDRRPTMIREMTAALASLPGAASAAATQRLPLRGTGDNWGMLVESRPELDVVVTPFRIVTPDYFETMGIRLVSGRGLLESDRLLGDEGVAVVNRAFVERFFPDRDPLGQRIAFTRSRWDRIVGVVDDVAESELTTGGEPARYVLYEHVPFFLDGQTLVLRMADRRDAAAALDAARRAVQTAAPGVAVHEVTTMAHVVDRAVGPARQVMTLLTLLSGLALALGVVGVYGVVSHFVTRRRRDWGIRIALGMRPAEVVRRIVVATCGLVGAGIAIGLVAFAGLSRVLAGFLYGVGAADPLALGMAAAILLAAGLLAALAPALRAGRTDPAMVLRQE